MGVTSGVRLDFVYRNSGGSVNSLSVVDTSVYDGVTDVSIGYIITLDGAIVYQDSVNTYSVNTPNGTLELEAPYDDNGVTNGVYRVIQTIKDNDTGDIYSDDFSYTLEYTEPSNALNIVIDGIASTITGTDANTYADFTLNSYELLHTDPRAVETTTTNQTLTVGATIYAGTHTFTSKADITYSATGITLRDYVVLSLTDVAYKLTSTSLWEQVDTLNEEYNDYLSTNPSYAERLKDKVFRCNVWQDDYERAILEGDTQLAYAALVNINNDLNEYNTPTVEEIPVYSVPSPTGHVHTNLPLLENLSDESGVLYYNGNPIEGNDGRVKLTSGDSLGFLNTKVTSNFTVSTTFDLSDIGSAGTYPKVTVDAKGRVTSGTTLSASDIPNLDWSKITSGKPTTLSGYGITDAVNVSLLGQPNGVATLDGDGNLAQLGDYVLASDYEDSDVLAKLLNVDGSGSGLDADYLRGITINTTGTSYIPYVNASGFLGIGRTPAYTLDVNGTVRLGAFAGYLKGTTGVISASSTIPETDISFTDVTTGNATASKHGYLPKLANTGTRYLRDDGTWQTALEFTTDISAVTDEFLSYTGGVLYYNPAYLDHNSLQNYDADRHALLDDSVISSTTLWSSEKIDATFSPNFEIRLNSGATVAQRLVGLVEGTDYPTGWVLSADESALVITHGLDSRSKVVKVLSKNGTTSNCVELQGNVAYSTKTDVFGTGYDAIRLDAFATITTELYVEIIL